VVPLTLTATAALGGVPVLLAFAAFSLGLDPAVSLEHGAPHLWEHVVVVVTALAALAALLRVERVEAVVSTWWRRLGRAGDVSCASAVFWGAFALCLVALPSLPRADGVGLLLPAAVLLLTPRRAEQAAALTLLSVAALASLPREVVVVGFSLGALALARAARTGHRLATVWFPAAGTLSLAALVVAGADVGAWTVPFAWSASAGLVWVVFGGSEKGRAWVWAATSAALHVVMGFVGVTLATGAPHVLIFPWWAAGSAGLALVRHFRGGQRGATAFSLVALSELVLGTLLLHAAWPREALVCVLVAGALAFIAWRRVVEDDAAEHAWLGQLAVVSGALCARVLASGALPGLTEAWVLLGVAALFAGLSRFLRREGRPASGTALSRGAWAWPLLAVALVPWTQWAFASSWLVGASVLTAWLSRTGRRTLALVPALTANLALVLAAAGVGFSQWHLVLVPFGLTLLALAWFFGDEVSLGARVQLRAWGMGLVYAAMAWKPLTVTSVGALVLCVSVCLAGVALGAAWRIRSYVLLGSGVVVTTVLATLVRSGLAEPRLGAVFLSLLGLGVVVVMVMISTRREELRERVVAMQRAMATWSP
jgi:hypothetical protein